MTANEIQKAFGHRLIGTRYMKAMVAKTVLLFPEGIIKKITKNVWFVSSFEDGWAFALRGSELSKNESLIFLSDELLSQNEGQISYTIAHEIGHITLGHRNAIMETQTKKETRKQEREADEFVMRYFRPSAEY